MDNFFNKSTLKQIQPLVLLDKMEEKKLQKFLLFLQSPYHNDRQPSVTFFIDCYIKAKGNKINTEKLFLKNYSQSALSKVKNPLKLHLIEFLAYERLKNSPSERLTNLTSAVQKIDFELGETLRLDLENNPNNYLNIVNYHSSLLNIDLNKTRLKSWKSKKREDKHDVLVKTINLLDQEFAIKKYYLLAEIYNNRNNNFLFANTYINNNQSAINYLDDLSDNYTENKAIQAWKLVTKSIDTKQIDEYDACVNFIKQNYHIIPKNHCIDILVLCMNFYQTYSDEKIRYIKTSDLSKFLLELDIEASEDRITTYIKVKNYLVSLVRRIDIDENHKWKAYNEAIDHYIPTHIKKIEKDFFYHWCLGYKYFKKDDSNELGKSLSHFKEASSAFENNKAKLKGMLGLYIDSLCHQLKVILEDENPAYQGRKTTKYDMENFNKISRKLNKNIKGNQELSESNRLNYESFLPIIKLLYKKKTDPNYRGSSIKIERLISDAKVLYDRKWLLNKLDEMV